MSVRQGPGPVPVDVDDLPEGWEAFATMDGEAYYSFPQVYYFCRRNKIVQWERPSERDALEPYGGYMINGRKPYEKGDEIIPDPPPEPEFEGALSDEVYKASAEDPTEVFQPDEDMFDACLDVDIEKLKTSLSDGADVSMPNQPWENTPLHLAVAPYFWDADTFQKEKELRLELVKYLVRQGADLGAENAFHCRPIDLAMFHQYEDAVRYLMEQGSEFGLYGAAFKGDLELVKKHIQEGVDIDMKGRYHRTAFAEAHLRNHFKITNFLVQQGCSRELPHNESMRFNPGPEATKRGELAKVREIEYFRNDDPEWFDDMMEKRFPGYQETVLQDMALREI